VKQIPLAIGPEAARTFENFLPGPNGAAVAHLQLLRPGAPPVYLWGPPGSGKSHLLHAAIERAQQQGESTAWFEAALPTPWQAPEHCDWIVLDDCQALDEAQQQAAFSLFVDAGAQGAVVLAAGSVPPVDLAVREDLRTRLGWGHVFALEPLAEPEVRSALRREADRRGTFLSDDVMDYLLTRFARDLKHLMAQLDRLDEFSLSTKRAITVPLLKQMLAEEGDA
jgi:DnaA family protein